VGHGTAKAGGIIHWAGLVLAVLDESLKNLK